MYFTNMRSILYQLKKYGAQEPLPVPPQPPQPPSNDPENPYAIEGIPPGFAQASIIQTDELNEPDKVYGIWQDILYPTVLAKMYDNTLSGKHTCSETTCDTALKNFINKQNQNQYTANYRKAMTDHIKTLTMLRVLLATYGQGVTNLDRVSVEYRRKALEFLKVQDTISASRVHDLLEQISKMSSIEQLILGRIGYLLLWNNLQGPTRVSDIRNVLT